MNTDKQIAKYLLQIKAIKLEPANPFTWASGWKSPIYCDNRKTLSFPEIRTYIRNEFVKLIRKEFPDVEMIAGVATGAIPQGALIADVMNLPFVYIRSSAKTHGLENLVEGEVNAGQKTVVIEDLISTGGSSLKAVEALRNEKKANVLGMAAIFSYGFKTAEDNFIKSDCKLYTLSNYNALIELAQETGYVKATEVEKLKEWRKDPANWKGL